MGRSVRPVAFVSPIVSVPSPASAPGARVVEPPSNSSPGMEVGRGWCASRPGRAQLQRAGRDGAAGGRARRPHRRLSRPIRNPTITSASSATPGADCERRRPPALGEVPPPGGVGGGAGGAVAPSLLRRGTLPRASPGTPVSPAAALPTTLGLAGGIDAASRRAIRGSRRRQPCRPPSRRALGPALPRARARPRPRGSRRGLRGRGRADAGLGRLGLGLGGRRLGRGFAHAGLAGFLLRLLRRSGLARRDVHLRRPDAGLLGNLDRPRGVNAARVRRLNARLISCSSSLGLANRCSGSLSIALTRTVSSWAGRSGRSLVTSGGGSAMCA